MASLGPLATQRIRRVITEIESRQLVAPRLWRGRLNRVKATDEEILARITADVIAADIVTNDAEAVVHGAEAISFTSGSVPKFKHGRMLSETNLALLDRIENNLASQSDRNIFDNYVNNAMIRLLQGIEDREEMVVCQMLEDTGVYDRLGVKFSGMTWGMPATYKITVANLWSNPSTATPIADILAAKKAAIDRDGTTFDRITLSQQGFNYAVATDEFKNRIKFGLTENQGNLLNLGYMNDEQKAQAMGQMLGMEVELYDAQTKIETLQGAKQNIRFSSANKVILSVKANDNNNGVWDFAIGVIQEKKVARLADVPGFDAKFGTGDEFGPFGYTTLANPTLNPPGLILWAVDRGFPRKHDDAANAVLTVY